MLKIKENYSLSDFDIDRISEQVVAVCESCKMEQKETIRLRLNVEEMLLAYQNRFGADCPVQLRTGTRFGKPYLHFSCPNENSFNPFIKGEEDVFRNSILLLLSKAPDYYYTDNINHIVFHLHQPEMNPILKLALIIFGSVLFALISSRFLPAAFLSDSIEYFISPTYNKFLDVLGCIAGPLIFFSVAWGIYGIGDVATLSKLGGSMILHFMRNVFLCCTASLLIVPIMGLSLSEGGVDLSRLMQIYQMFLDMLPTTIVDPFQSGNTMQIVILAVVLGLAMLYLGKRSTDIANLIGQMNHLISFIMEVISNLVPYFIIIVMVNLIWSGEIASLLNIYKVLLILVAAIGVEMLIFTVSTALRFRMSPLRLFSKLLPIFMIALSTASSAASFGTIVDTCRKKLGIDDALTGFGVPLGIVMHKCASGINSMVVVLFVASLTGNAFPVSWYVLAIIVSAVTAIATPPVPGGGVIAYTMLFSQMGLPKEYLSIILALDMLTDFLLTAAEMYCLPVALIHVADKHDLLNKAKLQGK